MQRSRRRGVDALVAVVPTDAIAGRRLSLEHLLNDPGAWWALSRLRLGFDPISDLQLHSSLQRSLLDRILPGPRRQKPEPRPQPLADRADEAHELRHDPVVRVLLR